MRPLNFDQASDLEVDASFSRDRGRLRRSAFESPSLGTRVELVNGRSSSLASTTPKRTPRPSSNSTADAIRNEWASLSDEQRGAWWGDFSMFAAERLTGRDPFSNPTKEAFARARR